jgi:hypothetical protein
MYINIGLAEGSYPLLYVALYMPSEVFHATCLHVWMFFGLGLLLTYSQFS